MDPLLYMMKAGSKSSKHINKATTMLASFFGFRINVAHSLSMTIHQRKTSVSASKLKNSLCHIMMCHSHKR